MCIPLIKKMRPTEQCRPYSSIPAPEGTQLWLPGSFVVEPLARQTCLCAPPCVLPEPSGSCCPTWLAQVAPVFFPERGVYCKFRTARVWFGLLSTSPISLSGTMNLILRCDPTQTSALQQSSHRLTQCLSVFFLLEKPDAKVKASKEKAVPQIVITRASNETLSSIRSEEQRTIQEWTTWGPYSRHRNPSTVDAYHLQNNE